MNRGRIKLEGGAELERKLKAIDAKLAKSIVKKALRAGAKVVLKAAKAKAPRKSGLLVKSLKVRSAKAKKGAVRMAVQTREGDFKGETFYAAFTEFGHRIGNRKLGNARKVVEAKPFLGPAFDASKDEAARAITETIKQGLSDL
jgi:HK97 gp10 family phage protein